MSDLDKIDQKLELLRSDLVDIKVDTAKNTANLEVHMKRTELNEARILKLERWHLGVLSTILVSVVVAVIRSFIV